MGVKLILEVTPPIGPDDLDLLGGASMTLLALIQSAAAANEPEEDPEPEPEPAPTPPGMN